uniref:Uncharacterized protein n=1 Tax=viral metagenome TaxID=1070528 RepID=A0A6C0FF28_9ZZZZ|tara:strand:+ start:1156 stop:1677 length:522 start_codon:yes stop_codon:yes gene_type:complete
MNTSELLVLIFAFLVGYMLFKRCGCIEGMVSDTCSDTLESLCGKEKKFPSQACAKCTGSKQSSLNAVGCTTKDVEQFCHTNTIPMTSGGLCYINTSLLPYIDQNKLKTYINGNNSITNHDCYALNKGAYNTHVDYLFGEKESVELSKSSLCAWLKKLNLNVNNCNTINPWEGL